MSHSTHIRASMALIISLFTSTETLSQKSRIKEYMVKTGRSKTKITFYVHFEELEQELDIIKQVFHQLKLYFFYLLSN